MTKCSTFLLLQALLYSTSCHSLQPQSTLESRRQAVSTIFTSIVTGGTIAATSTWPMSESSLANAAVTPATTSNRGDLLSAIARKASDEEVIGIIQTLKDPSNGRGAANAKALEGEWELLWSYKAEAFSPLLKLPKPFRPESYQYFGSAAAKEVGEGRIAQGLTGGILGSGNQLWLSSGAVPMKDNPSVLEIQPPFRFEVGGPYLSGKPKTTLVEAGNDAEFRKVNGRTKQAQMEGQNQYQQSYVEDNGPGSLRVSTVIAGDPVLVGEIFVHRKL